MSQYFRPYKSFRESITVNINLSNYATKTDLKNITHVDVSNFALKTNLASLKTEIVPVPNDLAKLSNVVKNDVVKKTEYDKLVGKVNNIDTTGFALNTKYDADNSKIEKILKEGSGVASTDDLDVVKNKIPNVSSFVVRTDFNSKITEVENKIPDISGSCSKSELTTVENKICDVSSLVTKTNYNTKLSEVEGKINNHNHDKYVTTTTLNALSTNLITKTKSDAELKKVNDRVTSNKAKDSLLENEMKKNTEI